MLVAILAPVSALAGVVIGQALPEVFTRRRLARKLYKDALTAVCVLQAALWNGQTNIDSEAYPILSESDLQSFRQELARESIKAVVAARAAARASLAALYPYSPDLRTQWDSAAIVADEDFDALIRTLVERSRKPTEKHRV
ncbi:MAG: hypothetical protein H0X28_12570 [Solirubrobacterales bacterium]|nr:hypothetical protein [Solirubrobacterales bacterium]